MNFKLLSESGLVYVCGESENGKLGIDVSFSTQVAPKQMQLPSPAVHVACGGHHTVILAGITNLNPLKIALNYAIFYLTSLISLALKKSETKRNSQYFPTLARNDRVPCCFSENGSLYCTGSNSTGQLALGTNLTELHTPKLLPRGALRNEKITRVSCGESHTAVVTGKSQRSPSFNANYLRGSRRGFQIP